MAEETPPTPRPPETLDNIREMLTAVPPEAEISEETVQLVHVVKHTELKYGPAARFQPGKVKEFIENLLKEKLGFITTYDVEIIPPLCRDLADMVKNELRDMNLPRYKIMVQSVVGESKDQGFQFASKSFWDPQTDDCTFGSFLNEHVFAVVGAWALYLT